MEEQSALSGDVTVRPTGETADPRVGLDVVGRSDAGTVLIGINDGMTVPATPESSTAKHVRTKEYQTRAIKVDVTAISSKGNVTIAST